MQKSLYEKWVEKDNSAGFTKESVKTKLEQLANLNQMTFGQYYKHINTNRYITDEIIEARWLFNLLFSFE